MLKKVLPWTTRCVARAIVMPNTRPCAILNGEDVTGYRDEILSALDKITPRPSFEPLMTIEIRDNTTPQMIVAAYAAGAIAGKVYPLGVTTNSDQGLKSFFNDRISASFKTMRDLGMPLLLHGEIDEPRTLVTEREKRFLRIFERLASDFPDLKMVFEHVSTKEAVALVEKLGPNVAATITAHHLMLTLNNVIGDGLRPHNACMPMPKGFEDRDALIRAATSGNPKFFLGSDSAPHLRADKECIKGACGVFSAPVLPEVLASVFDNHGALGTLNAFTSRFGAEFYGLPLNTDTITLVLNKWTVPEEIDGVVPFLAGATELPWKLQS